MAAGAAAPQPTSSNLLVGLSPQTASLLCYIPILGWVAAIIVLASTRFRNNLEVRFNAFQGLYLFVAWLIVDQVVSPFLAWPGGWALRHQFSKLLELAMIALWIFMIVKVRQGQTYRLPLLGELADRSVSEQRL